MRFYVLIFFVDQKKLSRDVSFFLGKILEKFGV